MKNSREIVFSLLKRLLAGERGDLPLHLAMLLEKSSPLDSGEDHYRKILPEQLAAIKLDAHTVDEITRVLCKEISRNPDSDLLFVVATTGATEVTRLAVDLLVRPPRLLSMRECGQALGILSSYLPFSLRREPQLLASETKEQLIAVLNNLQHSEDPSVQGHAQRLRKEFRRASE